MAAIAGLAVAWADVPAGASSEPVSYNRDVRPILSQHCFACHGPDEKTRKAGLRLDSAEEARRVLKSGQAAIVPGKPGESELVGRITATDEDDRMPPEEIKKPLSEAQVAILKRWIEEGAPYEGHWAYQPPVRRDPPEVRDTAWPRNDLDRFVLARLEREGLSPTPEAPREKLLRRATLDLTGLPPTVEEIDAFVADTGPKAYDTVVDRLLASPHYGERMAQQWLDLARYGETQGYHHDRHRDMWHWRDWVIAAFNENKPFNVFTTEQLAGDLLPNPTRAQRIATGFHRNEMTTSEGGALPEEYIVKYAVGRVDTTARVWLGTSMACAECHDHKYDPISQKEYYQFFAFFFDTPENGLDQEERNAAPRITLETPEQRERVAQLDREFEALQAAHALMLEAPRADWDAAQAAWEEKHRAGSLRSWQTLNFASSKAIVDDALRPDADGALPAIAVGAGPSRYELAFRTEATSLNGLRLEILGPPAHDRAVEPGPSASRRGLFVSRIDVSAHALKPEVARQDAPAWGDWQVVGPFAAGSRKEAFDREFGPEKDPDAAASWEDGRLRWTRDSGAADGAWRALGEKDRAYYLARAVTVREPRIVEVQVGSSGGLRVWLNGRSLIADHSARPSQGEGLSTRLWLRPGENRLLVKVVPGEGDRGFRFQASPDAVTSVDLEIASGASDGQEDKDPVRGVLDDRPETGWGVEVGAMPAARREAFFLTREAYGFPGGTELRVRLHLDPAKGSQDGVRFRLTAASSESLPEFVQLPDAVRRSLGTDAAALDDAQRQVLRRHFREHLVPEVRQARLLADAKRKERDDERNAWPTAMVMRKAEPMRETHFLIRGQYHNKGEKVGPGVPERLFPWVEGLPRDRLGLARWLMHPDHPLTARVIVNQYWQKYFGSGLVKTSEDFGAQGEWPSHPELLDWLATEFIRSGWDIKALQRLIVTSATYRQDSRVTPELLERDPENRLLARGPRFRLDAENIRDLAMAASGLLDPRIGGPSVFPYQPPGLWGQVSFEGTRDYEQSQGADNYRRGLYTYWRRSIPYASFTVFDAPSREVCVIRRPRTNTPLQALALMNDPVYVEAARALAQRVLAQGGDSLDARIRFAFRLVVGREATSAEREVLAKACAREFERFAADREAANRLIHVGASKPPVDVDIAELAAWTVLANTLLNLDEAITKG